MSPEAETKFVVGLIGSGISGSFSPPLHEREAARLGLGYEYRVLDLDELGREPDEVGELLRELGQQGFRGVNITHPCKQLALPFLDELASEARALGAVNTVVFDNGRSVGHNTDCSGFLQAFEFGLPSVDVDDVIVLGAGGAGTAVAHAILLSGAKTVTVIDLDWERAVSLAESLAAQFNEQRVNAAPLTALQELLETASGLIHATPTGMAAQPGSPVPPEWLDGQPWVVDIVYVPVDTQLLKDARSIGCRTLGGAAMVTFQAASSFALFTGVEPDTKLMLAHASELIDEAAQLA